MQKTLALFLIILISLISCRDIEKQYLGLWVIAEIEADFVILTNVLSLNEDHSCDLPMVNIDERRSNKEIGTWHVFKKES